jgi:hypothetical protein
VRRGTIRNIRSPKGKVRTGDRLHEGEEEEEEEEEEEMEEEEVDEKEKEQC